MSVILVLTLFLHCFYIYVVFSTLQLLLYSTLQPRVKYGFGNYSYSVISLPTRFAYSRSRFSIAFSSIITKVFFVKPCYITRVCIRPSLTSFFKVSSMVYNFHPGSIFFKYPSFEHLK